MKTLHYFPSNASFAPHIVLEEIGEPFALALVDRANNAHKSAEYLKLNPNGLIPVLVDDHLVLYEAAAICLHLADIHVQRSRGLALIPALGTEARAQLYKWLIWSTNSLQAAMIPFFYPERFVATGNTAGAAEVRHAAQQKIGAYLLQIESHLADTGGPWMLGVEYSILDPYVFMLCRWTRFFEGEVPPARAHARLGAHMKRMLERPAVQRAIATEKLQQPLI
jgi:glutathione S-transferase